MSVSQEHRDEVGLKREHDSVDDFEHLEHDVQESQGGIVHPEKSRVPEERKDGGIELDRRVEPDAIAQPSSQVSSVEMEDPKKASVLFVEAERTRSRSPESQEAPTKPDEGTEVKPTGLTTTPDQPAQLEPQTTVKTEDPSPAVKHEDEKPEEIREIRESVLPVPEKSPTLDFLGDVTTRKTVDDSWNVVEKSEETKPLPPTPQDPVNVEPKPEKADKFEMSNDFVFAEAPKKPQLSGPETGESEFESEAEASPAKTIKDLEKKTESCRKVDEIEIAPKEIFKSMGIDAWFNPERLNPKVAALIYWRDPKKSGIVFGAILGVLLSLAYFSLISVLAYLSLLILTGTVAFRIYKTVLQAVQKTSDGHPFKDILDLDLTLPAEKVHEVADVAVAHANAAVSELRRLFLVEDFVDSVKFGVLLWCLTYVGSWFNGMTLIIIGVVALFTLPKVYETNKAQIDQNLALMQGKINELTAKVKVAIPLGKKPEPTKEE